MRRLWRIFRLILLFAAVACLYAGYRTFWGKPFTFNTLLNRQAAYLLFDNPQLLTSLGLIDR